MQHLLSARLGVVCLLALVACGGGGGKDDDDDDTSNSAPTASFTVSALAVNAGDALVFDAGASSDPDGDTLTYSWAFGGGGRGGAARLAHIFSVTGSQVVTLTVSDGRGGKHQASQTITVNPGLSPLGSATASVRVLDPDGHPIEGATVVVLGGATATTNSGGDGSLAIGTGVRQVVRVEAAGFARRTHVANLEDGVTTAFFELVMQPLGTARSLADAAAGGTIEDDIGSKVTLAARSLVKPDGNVVNGAVDVYVSPVDVTTNPRAFPGSFSGRDAEGASRGIVSFGTVDFNFMKDGEKLDLAPGQTATIEVPVFPTLDQDGTPMGVDQIIPLWSLDEESGEWILEGEGTIVASASSPTGYVQRATVGHFSWWNCDDFIGPSYDTQFTCCLDIDDDGDCDEPTACFLVGRTCSDPSCDEDSYNVPQYAPTDSLEGGQAKTLIIPVATTMALEAYGPNGLTRGRYISVANVQAPSLVTIVLAPFSPPPPTDEPLTLPFDATVAAEDAGAVTEYDVVLTAGQHLYVSVGRGSASSLTGRVRLLSPSNQELQNLTFGTGNAVFIHDVVSDGTYHITVQGIAPTAVGTYRMQVFDVGDGMTVVAMDPAAGSVGDPPGSVKVTFSRPPNPATLTSTSFKVFGPVGQMSPVGGITVSGLEATFVPNGGFGAGFSYRVELTTAIKDGTNVALAAPYTGTFSTNEVVGVYGRAANVGGTEWDFRMSDDGSAMGVWSGPGRAVFLRYVPDVGWELPDYVPGPASGVYQTARVSMTTGGRAMVTYMWSANGNPPNTPYAVFFDPTTGWGTPMALDVDATAKAKGGYGVAQAMDANGHAFFCWPPENSGDGWYSYYTPASGWSAPATIGFNPWGSGGNERVALNANGDGVLMWRHSTTMRYRRIHPNGTVDAYVDLGNNQSGTREAAVDTAGNIFLLRVDGSNLSYVHRLPIDTENEVPYVHQIEGAVNAANCVPRMGVTPTGAVGTIFCKSSSVPTVQRWDGDTTHAWDTAVTLDAVNGLTYTAFAAVGEEFVTVYSRSSNPLRFREYDNGAWSGADVTFTGSSFVNGVIAASTSGRAIYMHYDGHVLRLR